MPTNPVRAAWKREADAIDAAIAMQAGAWYALVDMMFPDTGPAALSTGQKVVVWKEFVTALTDEAGSE